MATDIKKAIHDKMKARKMKCTDLAKLTGINARRVQEFFSEETLGTLRKSEQFIDAVGLEICEAKTAEKLAKAEKLLLMLWVEIAKENNTNN